MYPNINELARRACAEIHGSQGTRLEGLLSRYLPVADMSLDELSSELSPATVATLCVDRPASGFCDIVVDGMEEIEELQPSIESFDLTVERPGVNQAPKHGYTYVARFIYDAMNDTEDPDVSALRPVEDVDPYEFLHHEYDWDNWKYWQGQKAPRKVRRRPSRDQSGRREPVLTAQHALANPSGQIAFADLIGGEIVNGYPRPSPVRQWTDAGPLSEPDTDWVHRLSHDRLYIAPVEAGYSRSARRFQWFGRKFKFLNGKPREDTFTMNLGDLLRIVSAEVRDILGEEYTQSTSVRPTGRGIIALGESDAHCDLWPISPHVSLAIGIVSHSQRGSLVRTLRNWSQGKLGKSEHTSVELDKDLASLLFSYVDRERRGRGAAGRFVMHGAPEPVVNLTSDVLDKIINTIVKRTLSEQATVIILEGI